MAQTDSFTCLCQLQPGILKEEKGRQDAAGETAILAQQTAFALTEKLNMGSALLSGASLGHMGSVQPQRETTGLYSCFLKLFYGKIH